MARRKRSRQITLLEILENQKDIKIERACRAKISLLLDLLEFKPQSRQPVVSERMKKKNNKNKKAVGKNATKDSRGHQEPMYLMQKGGSPLKFVITNVSPSETYNKASNGNKGKSGDAGLEDEHDVPTAKKAMLSNSQAEPDQTCVVASSADKKPPYDFDLNLPPSD